MCMRLCISDHLLTLQAQTIQQCDVGPVKPNGACYVRECTDYRAAVLGVSQKYFRPSVDRGCTCGKPKTVVVPVVLL